MVNVNLVVSFYLFLVFSCIFSGLLKAYFHMEYLKQIYPDNYKLYDNYFSTFLLKTYNVRLQFLFLPFFTRTIIKETELAKKQIKHIWFFLILSIFFLIAKFSFLFYISTY